MNKNIIFGGGIVIVVIVVGIVNLAGQKSPSGSQNDSSATQQSASKDEGKMIAGFSGKVLAGNSSPYLDFTKADYNKSLTSGKIVFLDFYANWCPICREEAPNLKAGFDALQTDRVVGFRVNYNDSETDEDEKKLAQEFGITYQHTKVILRNGKEISKSLESWDKETFLKEINSAL